MERCFLHITECALRELRSLGEAFAAAAAAAAALPVLRCSHKFGHSRTMDASACLLSIIGDANPLKFLVATQDADTRAALRGVPGVPLLLYSQNVLVLEPPSKASRGHAASAEARKNGASDAERLVVKVATGKLPKAALAALRPAPPPPAAAGAGAVDREAAPVAEGGITGALRRSDYVPVADAAIMRLGGGGGPSLTGTKRKVRSGGPSGPNPLSVRRKARPAVAAAERPPTGADIPKKVRRRHRPAASGGAGGPPLENAGEGAGGGGPPAAKRARASSSSGGGP